jgi:hypothetical protein
MIPTVSNIICTSFLLDLHAVCFVVLVSLHNNSLSVISITYFPEQADSHRAALLPAPNFEDAGQ